MTTNFLEYSGGTNGRLTTALSLFTTELNTKADLNTTVSSVNGSSGVFTQTNYGSAIWCYIVFIAGGTFTPSTVPADIRGWFLKTDDGTNYETLITANADLPRAPDWIIPMDNAAFASTNRKSASGPVLVPFLDHKALCRTNLGVSLPASGNIIKAVPVAWQY